MGLSLNGADAGGWPLHDTCARRFVVVDSSEIKGSTEGITLRRPNEETTSFCCQRASSASAASARRSCWTKKEWTSFYNFGEEEAKKPEGRRLAGAEAPGRRAGGRAGQPGRRQRRRWQPPSAPSARSRRESAAAAPPGLPNPPNNKRKAKRTRSAS